MWLRRWLTACVRKPVPSSADGPGSGDDAMRFCFKLIVVVWLLGALWVRFISGGIQITSAGGLTELFAYSFPGILFAIPALLITWLAVGFRWARPERGFPSPPR